MRFGTRKRAQRRFVLWWDAQEKHKGGRPTENPSQIDDGLKAQDYGVDCDTIHRWRKRLNKFRRQMGGKFFHP